MNRQSCDEIVERWVERRTIVDGRCLYKPDATTAILRALTPREKRYFFEGELPHWRKAFSDDR